MAGGIPVLIAAISPASQAAVSESCNLAVDAIHSLTSRAALPSKLVDEAEDLLLHLQAVPRLITFLRSLAHVYFPHLDAGSSVLLPLCTCSALPLTELFAFLRVFVQLRPQVIALHSVAEYAANVSTVPVSHKLLHTFTHCYALVPCCIHLSNSTLNGAHISISTCTT